MQPVDCSSFGSVGLLLIELALLHENETPGCGRIPLVSQLFQRVPSAVGVPETGVLVDSATAGYGIVSAKSSSRSATWDATVSCSDTSESLCDVSTDPTRPK